MTSTASYLDLVNIEQQTRAMRDAALHRMAASGVARLRALFAPRPVARAA